MSEAKPLPSGAESEREQINKWVSVLENYPFSILYLTIEDRAELVKLLRSL